MATVDRKPRMAAQRSGIAAEVGEDLLRAALSVSSHLELPDLLQAVLDPVVEWTGATCGFGLGPTEDGKKFVPLASSVPRNDPRYRAFHSVDPSRIRKAVPTELRVVDGPGPVVQFATKWPAEPPRATFSLPVLAPNDRWAGVLFLALDEKPGSVALSRVAALRELVRPAAANALQVLSLRQRMIKDDTAQCYNRRYFEEFLPEELSRASRFRAPLSLIFLDMDNLKAVNNAHGHAMGSRTLYEVSVRVRSKIRRFDKLFRFGGDEFCIVLPETEWHGAMEVAERVRDAVARKPFLLGEQGTGDGTHMTASLGVASFPLHARNQRELIERADRAMQRVKNDTKNSIAVAEVVGEDT